MSVARAPFAPPETLEEKLGKIQSFRIGLDEGRFGYFFTLGDGSWGVQDSFYTHADPPTAGAKWTEVQRETKLGEMSVQLITLLKEAKVTDARDLVGKPVMASFEGMRLVGWRILTEVL